MARGKDGLYRRDGDILCFRYKDAEGRWKERSTGKRKRDEARTFKSDFLLKLKNGELPNEKSEQTVLAACTRWTEQHKTSGPKGGLRSAHGRKCEQSYLRQLTKRLGSRKLKSIKLDDLKDYQASRGVRGRPINCELQILVNVLKEANLWYGTLKNYKRLPEETGKVGSALNAGQKGLLESTAATRDSWEVAFHAETLAINTGLRGGEIKKLRLGHIDLEKKQLTVVHGKSPKSNRTVQLNNAALGAITKLWIRAGRLGARDPKHFLLPGDLSAHTKASDPLRGKGGYDPTIHQESWSTAWRNLRKAAAGSITAKAKEEKRELTFAERKDIDVLGKLGFHSMRRSFITTMAEKNVPLPVTMAMVGHMSAQMTEHYTQISDAAQRRAVELLDVPAISPEQTPQEVKEERVYRA
jgi:integrase